MRLCCFTSSNVTLRFVDAPATPARSFCVFVNRIQSICEYPAPRCTFFPVLSADCVPADAGALSLFNLCTPPPLACEMNVDVANKPPNDRPESFTSSADMARDTD